MYSVQVKQWQFSLGGENMDVLFHFSTFVYLQVVYSEYINFIVENKSC